MPQDNTLSIYLWRMSERASQCMVDDGNIRHDQVGRAPNFLATLHTLHTRSTHQVLVATVVDHERASVEFRQARVSAGSCAHHEMHDSGGRLGASLGGLHS